MAITEKHLPVQLSKKGNDLLLSISESTLKQTKSALAELNKVLPKVKKERLIQSYSHSIHGIFKSWYRKVKRELQGYTPGDKTKILYFLIKELNIQVYHSEDFPFASDGRGLILSKSLREIQIHFIESLRDAVIDISNKADKEFISAPVVKGERKIIWLGNKQQLENLIDNLISKRCIKAQGTKSESIQVFLTCFKSSEQKPFGETTSTKKLKLDISTAKIFGGVLRELINKGWIFKKSPAYTQDRIAESISKILSGTNTKTIKNGMAMYFEDEANNPLSDVKDLQSSLSTSTPFDKIKSFELKKFKQLPSKI